MYNPYPEVNDAVHNRIMAARANTVDTIVKNMMREKMWVGSEAALRQKMLRCAELKSTDQCRCNHIKKDGVQCKRPGVYRGYCKQHVGDHLDDVAQGPPVPSLACLSLNPVDPPPPPRPKPPGFFEDR